MDAQVRIKVHVQDGGQRVATVTTSAKRLGANIEGKKPGWHIAAFYG